LAVRCAGGSVGVQPVASAGAAPAHPLSPRRTHTPPPPPHAAAAFLTQTIQLDDCIVRFELWDTAGQERCECRVGDLWCCISAWSRSHRGSHARRPHPAPRPRADRSLAPMYYRGAAAAVVVFDLLSRESFEGAKSWVRELQRRGDPNVVIALAGNKVRSGAAGGSGGGWEGRWWTGVCCRRSRRLTRALPHEPLFGVPAGGRQGEARRGPRGGGRVRRRERAYLHGDVRQERAQRARDLCGDRCVHTGRGSGVRARHGRIFVRSVAARRLTLAAVDDAPNHNPTTRPQPRSCRATFGSATRTSSRT
jgi:hypothetical protein